MLNPGFREAAVHVVPGADCKVLGVVDTCLFCFGKCNIMTLYSQQCDTFRLGDAGIGSDT